MNFNSPQQVEQVCYEMRLSDYPRGQNRARINDLFNGVPPYTEDETKENGIEINVNYLEGTGLAHDARSQFYQNFLKPGRYFSMRTDSGPKHKRSYYNQVVSYEMNRIMKGSLDYLETYRSKFALDVMHGVGPASWMTPYCWCPDPIGIEDVGIPAKTLLTMKNLPFFYIYRSYTAPEIIKLIRTTKRDPGWNVDMAEKAISWIDREMMSLMGSNWPEVWAPEKAAERVKGDGGFYCGDQVPTIDTFDFYFWADDGKKSGWRRRIILDSWSAPGSSGKLFTRKTEDPFSLQDFLYSSKERNVADSWHEIISFQFADLSAVAPFQYHSVRSLGFLLYAVCHLQNRMRCKFNESVFEALMMYFRVKTMEDAQRLLKVNLHNRGFIDETAQFIPANERFQVNSQLVQLGLTENAGLIQRHVASYVQQSGQLPPGAEGKAKNKLQVLSELNAMTMMVSAGLLQAYSYQNFENTEIKRRFFQKNPSDPDINLFQARCLRRGVPEELLVSEAWETFPERTLGAGNKTMEMAVVDMLMQARNLYDPEPQRDILRDFTLAVTDDPNRAETLVPFEPVRVSDAVHDAQLAAGALMQGLPVALKTGINHIDYVEAMLASMAIVIQKGKNNGNMVGPEALAGLQNMALNIQQHIGIVAQDQTQKALTAKFAQQLQMLMQEVKGFAQRLQEQIKAQQAQGGQQGMDPKAIAKMQEIKLMGDMKRQTMSQARAQRQAERAVEFEMEMKRDMQKNQAELAHDINKMNQELAATAHEARLKTQTDLREHGAEMAKKGMEAATDLAIAKAKLRAVQKKKKSDA